MSGLVPIWYCWVQERKKEIYLSPKNKVTNEIKSKEAHTSQLHTRALSTASPSSLHKEFLLLVFRKMGVASRLFTALLQNLREPSEALVRHTYPAPYFR